MQNYSLIEKLAIVKILDEIIFADEKQHPGEKKMLESIMNQMEFNASFVEEARKMKFTESLDILKRMPLARKKLFAELMHKIAIADGYIDENETNLVIEIYKLADIDIDTAEPTDTNPDLSFVYFESKGYYEYPQGEEKMREFLNVTRLIKLEPVINTPDKYALLIYDAGENNSLWGRDITLKPIELTFLRHTDG